MYDILAAVIAGELARAKACREAGIEYKPPPAPAREPKDESHCGLWVAIAFIFGVSL